MPATKSTGALPDDTVVPYAHLPEDLMPHEFIDPFAPFGRVDTSRQEAEKKATTHSDNGVPKGTSKEVLKWVDGDPEKARLALDAEQADGTPRKGLEKDLQELVGEDQAAVEDAAAQGDDTAEEEEPAQAAPVEPASAEPVPDETK